MRKYGHAHAGKAGVDVEFGVENTLVKGDGSFKVGDGDFKPVDGIHFRLLASVVEERSCCQWAADSMMSAEVGGMAREQE